VEGSGCGPTICLQELKNTIKNFIKDNAPPGTSQIKTRNINILTNPLGQRPGLHPTKFLYVQNTVLYLD
jgi:hypothetical protein